MEVFGWRKVPRPAPTPGVRGRFGLAVRGSFLAGAPFTAPVILIGELALSVNASGDGVINGHIAGSKNGTILTFAEELLRGRHCAILVGS
jgi:hypothetical protein